MSSGHIIQSTGSSKNTPVEPLVFGLTICLCNVSSACQWCSEAQVVEDCTGPLSRTGRGMPDAQNIRQSHERLMRQSRTTFLPAKPVRCMLSTPPHTLKSSGTKIMDFAVQVPLDPPRPMVFLSLPIGHFSFLLAKTMNTTYIVRASQTLGCPISDNISKPDVCRRHGDCI